MSEYGYSPACQRYVLAWTEALRGGEPPRLDEYLLGVAAGERDRIRAELLAVEPLCRQLFARFRGRENATAEWTVVPDTVDNTAGDGQQVGATGEYAAPGAGGTTEFRPGVATHEGAAGETTAFNAANLGKTIDAAGIDTHPRPELMTGAFELDPAVDAGGRPPGADGQSRKQRKLPHVPGYELLSVLGRGGMGVVYKAKQVGLNRLVALKMILSGEHASQLMLDRFQAEAMAVAHLQHPHIVQIYEVNKLDGLPYFSLEFVDGGTLNDKIDHKPQPPRIAAEMVEALARAMHHAHQHGVIHRDLKPANVLLQNVEEGAHPSVSLHDRSYPQAVGEGVDVWEKPVVPKITDFGLAKRLEGDSSQTRTGTILGTPSYMAPEQARGDTRAVGPLADVYALGAILYEMLTGRPPFLAATPMETVMAVLKEEPLSPTQLQPRIPRDLETICLKCLQKESAKRYASAGDLADDLRRFLQGESIRARPVGRPERFWRWCRRNPKVTMLSATILSLLIMCFVTALAFVIQLNQQRIAAEEARDAAMGSTDLALDSLGLMVREVQQKLDGVPNAGPIRKDLLNLAMEQLQRVEQDFVKNQGKTERSQAAAYLLMGTILWDEPGGRDQAAEYYRRCFTLVEELHKANPESDKARKNLAVAHHRMGDVSLVIHNDARQARQHYEEALRILGELLERPALGEGLTRTEVSLAHANAEAQLVQVLLQLDQPAAARPRAESNLALMQAELAQKSDDPELQFGLGSAHLALADVHRRLGNDADYHQHANAGMQLLESARKARPNNLAISRGLARGSAAAGDYALRHKDAAAAEPHYRRNLAITQELASLDPSLALQRDVAMAHYRMGAAEQSLGRTAQARESFAACLKLREEIAQAQNDRRSRIQVMVALARCGKHDQLREKIDEILRTDGKTPAILKEIACAYGSALATLRAGRDIGELPTEEREQAEQLAREAVAALTEGTAAGNVDLVNLDTDPDLFALHDLAAYQQWKAAVQARTQPKP